MVAAFAEQPAEEPRLLTAREAFREKRGAIVAGQSVERQVVSTCVVVVLGVAFAVLVAAAIDGRSLDRDSVAVYAGILLMTAITAGIVAGGVMLDMTLGAEKWLATLPRVELAFGATPTGYRA
jgi:hypothetical protein